MTRRTMAMSVCTVALSIAVATSAAGQGIRVRPSAPAIGRAIGDAPQTRHVILVQQADTERMRVETERTQAEIDRLRAENESRRAEALPAPPPPAPTIYQPYLVAASGDPLVVTDAATYRLGNGVTVRVSGVLRPSDTATCTAHCR